ncbi:MAG: energy transducer TonB [Deltaproteobacteria bacterium]|nr:energy transducer TonB [Deltaproteobacteria bacterium]
MEKEIRGIIIGAFVSGAIHFAIFSLPICLAPAIQVKEMPGSMEVSLVVQQQARWTKTPPEAIKGKMATRPARQKIKAPGLRGEAFVRQTLPMADARFRAPYIKEIGDSVGEKSDHRGDSSLAIPRYEGNPKPPYPEVARKRGYEGTVRLEVEVLASGRVGRIRVKESAGYEVLDRSALDTVKGWSFIPAKLGGVPVKSTVIVPITFQLKD